MKDFVKWFNLKFGWFFINGRKKEQWNNYIKSMYPESILNNQNMSNTKNKSASLCEQAHKIVNERDEEKERMYGPFSEGMDRAASIFSASTGIKVEGRHMFLAMVALKLSRESYNHKQDNLLDAIAYLQGLENYENQK
jgi:hypothetical protein